MACYTIEPRTRKYGNGYGFLSFSRNVSNKHGKQLLGRGLNALKTASKKIVHKAVEATGEFIGNKITDKIVKPNENPRKVEEIIIPPENWKEILNEL